MARRFTVSGTMYIQDYETFGDNETELRPFAGEAHLDDDQLEQVIDIEEGTGGEIRTQLEINARLLSNQNIRVEGSVTLWEGTSETTTDFGGQRHFNFIVKKGKTVNYKTKVMNEAEDEPDDFARVSFTCKNAAA